MTDHDDEVDRGTLSLLEALRAVPPRDPQAAATGKERFLAQAEALRRARRNRLRRPTLRERPPAAQVEFAPGREREARQLPRTRRARERAAWGILARAVVLALSLLALFGGATALAYLALDSLPGQALYPLKTSAEQAARWLTPSGKGAVRLRVNFAGRRVEEMRALMAAGRHGGFSRAAASYADLVEEATGCLAELAADERDVAQKLALAMDGSLEGHVEALSALLAEAPEEGSEALARALVACREARERVWSMFTTESTESTEHSPRRAQRTQRTERKPYRSLRSPRSLR